MISTLAARRAAKSSSWVMTGSARDAATAAIARASVDPHPATGLGKMDPQSGPHSGGIVVDGQRFHIGNGFQGRQALSPDVGRRRGQHADAQFGEGDDGGGDPVGDQRLVELPAAFGRDEHRRVEHSGGRRRVVGTARDPRHVAGKDREVVTEPGIGLSAAQPRQELRFAQPTPAPRTNRGKHRDRTAADGDGDVLPCPHAAQHAGRIVTQLTRGHLRHAYDRSSIVGQTGCSPDGARAAEVPQPTPGTTGAASVGAEQSRSA
ncbi:hypothetical protein J113_04450 [Mycobacterium tuberculosis CAS/NITR204]|uniref:Uncharacterized protein n=1 Tax=Mycobacterium tuberculosis CAS/NITR204 TaxID=1310114 RepID=R4MAF9_MYCTX|nr:hypothetical protein J113_04450 [Mycobacterium tuberculosis CAS/NITR204]